ncbi:hypothetical protein NDU88_006212 [Pleurodeles waltl]|uniref:Uncharacterized protein n=1 Tax=Pleurodeles waltl TaxID=8319 RepID=A0AAV7TDS2_PLEWA|nr:hypothetical protein NDU88_006212 [Pleurodeles waltl]
MSLPVGVYHTKKFKMAAVAFPGQEHCSTPVIRGDVMWYSMPDSVEKEEMGQKRDGGDPGAWIQEEKSSRN